MHRLLLLRLQSPFAANDATEKRYQIRNGRTKDSALFSEREGGPPKTSEMRRDNRDRLRQTFVANRQQHWTRELFALASLGFAPVEANVPFLAVMSCS